MSRSGSHDVLCAVLSTAATLALAGTAEAAPWPVFAGTNGRSGFAASETGAPPLARAWSATGVADQGVWTAPIVTQGERRLVAYGTQKPYWMSGPTSSGNVHLRDLATGQPVGPAAGVVVDQGGGDSDTFGSDNKAQVPFVDSSAPGGPPGQLFVVHNDDGAAPGSDVAIAQVDLATGALVRDVPVPDTPHVAPGGASVSGKGGSDVTGSPALQLDAGGDGVLVFRVGVPVYDAGGSVVRKIERVFVVPVRNARSPAATIDTAHQRVTPDFQATSRTSPTLVALTDPSTGAPATYVAMGTSEPGTSHYVRTFRLSDLAPGPTSDVLAGWGQTVATPFGASGEPPPYLVVATGSGSTGRVYRLEQRGSRLAVVRSVTLSGHPSPALALTGAASAPSEGKVVVATEKNLYVLRASDLATVAKLSPTSLSKGCAPCKNGATPPTPARTGFYVPSPTVAGSTVYVARDDGSQLALDLATAQPLSAGQFTQDPGNVGSTFTRGAPAIADGHVIFASSKGIFAYRLSEPAPPPPGNASTFTPAADAHVKSTGPTRTYGALATLRVRQGDSSTPDTYRTLLRFDLAGLTGPVTDAKLRLWVTDPSPDGGSVTAIASSWSESTVTWDTAPPAGTAIGSIGATSAAGSWTEVSVDGAVTGDGAYAFSLQSASSNSAIYDSRESQHPPQLVVTTG